MLRLRGIHAVWLLCLCGYGLVGCADTTSQATPEAPVPAGSVTKAPLKKVRLLLNWFPEPEHGGFYAAQVHGFYAAEGLDVEILPGGPNSPVVQQVASRQVEFGVTNADNVIFGRAEEVPIKALMAPLQISPRCLMVHQKSGITKFEQLQDMTIAMSATNAFSHYLRKKFPFTGVRMVPYPGNITQFLQDEKFAQQGYTFSEPILARQQGSDPQVLLVADVGFNPYTSCLIAHDQTIVAETELVRKMVQASVKGWEKYIAEPEETNAKLHQLNPEMGAEMLTEGVQELKKLVVTEQTATAGVGNMQTERWDELLQQLVEIEQVKPGRVTVMELFTSEFMPQK